MFFVEKDKFRLGSRADVDNPSLACEEEDVPQIECDLLGDQVVSAEIIAGPGEVFPCTFCLQASFTHCAKCYSLLCLHHAQLPCSICYDGSDIESVSGMPYPSPACEEDDHDWPPMDAVLKTSGVLCAFAEPCSEPAPLPPGISSDESRKQVCKIPKMPRLVVPAPRSLNEVITVPTPMVAIVETRVDVDTPSLLGEEAAAPHINFTVLRAQGTLTPSPSCEENDHNWPHLEAAVSDAAAAQSPSPDVFVRAVATENFASLVFEDAELQQSCFAFVGANDDAPCAPPPDRKKRNRRKRR